MAGLWDAVDTVWHDSAACRGVPAEVFFPETEDDRSLAVARAWCDTCPVRGVCLNAALIRRDSGIWGGTSTRERSQLARVRKRTKCPVCALPPQAKVKTLVSVLGPDGVFEICLGCGASWKAGNRPSGERSDQVPAVRAG